MQEFQYTIKDPNGIHARPAGLLVQALQRFESDITVSKGEMSCDGKKLFALMKLRVKLNDTIAVRIEGADEAAAIETARAFLTENM